MPKVLDNLPQTPTQSSKDKGLRPQQVLILSVLADTDGALSRSEICDRTGLDATTGIMCPMLGSVDANARDAAEKRTKIKSLMTLDYARCHKLDIDGITEYGYQITEAGFEALKDSVEG